MAVAVPPAAASVAEDAWSMTVVDGSSANLVGAAAMTFTGSWRQVPGLSGDAVEFTDATSYGVAAGTEGQNPRTSDFAVSEVFTSEAIPDGVGYSGNLMQKGRYGSPGQIKMQLVPLNGGSVACRVKGTNGAKTLRSTVVVDDGDWHTTTCWREGGKVGLTVDGVSTAVRWNPGSIANRKALRVGNKSDTADWTDQHFGAVDCSVYALGTGARAHALSMVPC